MNKSLFVTQPWLPPLEEFIPYLEKIWENKILTNCGYFHQQLEIALCEYLGVEHISLFTNATIALITALQALNIKGEVITTPYSFVATSHSLLWNNIKPVFVDIDSHFNLNPKKIEAAITSHTAAIMPVHCYGNPCDVKAIREIANKYKLKVIYDAAHAFGVKYKGCSILTHGNLSVLSFHATKVFNTFEGGAIISPNIETKRKIDQLKNFGFKDESTVLSVGINGKMSEFNSALGLLQLKYVDQLIAQRKVINDFYRSQLTGIKGIRYLDDVPETISNYGYFPILVDQNYPINRDELYIKLKDNNIYSRRYFYPLISEFPVYSDFPSADRKNLPVATEISQQILCLPIYPALDLSDIKFVARLIKEI